MSNSTESFGNAGAAALRKQLDSGELIVCPGIYDGISGRVALHKGFKALYMTGAGTVASRLGVPDLGVAGVETMLSNASMLAQLGDALPPLGSTADTAKAEINLASTGPVPVIADADTGYGGSLACARTLSMYARAGVAALHVEDQVQSKRCGHLQSKQVVSTEEFVSRVKAMDLARKQMGSKIVIIARSDAVAAMGIDEGISRCKAAVAAGADVAFVEAIKTDDDARKVIKAMSPTPCLVNIVPGGSTPNWSVQQIRDLGFKIAIFPGALLFPVRAALGKALDELLVDGKDPAGDTERYGGIREFFNEMGLQEAVALDQAAGATALGAI